VKHERVLFRTSHGSRGEVKIACRFHLVQRGYIKVNCRLNFVSGRNMAGRHTASRMKEGSSKRWGTLRRQRINKKKHRNENKKVDMRWRGVVGGGKKLDKKKEAELKMK